LKKKIQERIEGEKVEFRSSHKQIQRIEKEEKLHFEFE